MLNLKSFHGDIYVNDNPVPNDFDFSVVTGHTVIRLVPECMKIKPKSEVVQTDGHKTYVITVKQYMTQKGSPDFDFMTKWNNDNPMPLRTMTGWIEKETRGMLYMHLHGTAQQTITCMRCGRELTNPISRQYGIGPECIQKLGFALDMNDVDEIKEKLVETDWSGWIIRSAIVDMKEA